MFTKFVRFVAALAIIVSVAGNTEVARADRGAPPSVSVQNLQPPRAPEPQPLDSPALTIPPASSLGVQFVHVATAANTAGPTTTIDHPLTNGNPNAIILVTPNYHPGGFCGCVFDNHPISVYYSGGQWIIFNQDNSTMPVGAAFNVIIPTAGAGVFVHNTTSGNSSGSHTLIDNAMTNGHPNAVVFVTPNWSPGGVFGTKDAHSISLYYDTGASKWAIFNQDGDVMPDGAAFNVSVLSAGAGVFFHTATISNSTGNYTEINNPLTNGHPNAIVFVTANETPGGSGGGGIFPIGMYNIAVAYDGNGKWVIGHQDGVTAMPPGVSFNVLVLVPRSDIFVHTATTGNIVGAYTEIDNALTNGHPNAIVFTTPNYNPGGVGGTPNNHNINVAYSGNNKWVISNPYTVAMPPGAAFNVLVPNPDAGVFVHKATADNINVLMTTIDNPLTNGRPNAIIFVSPNWNPGSACGCVQDDHPIGVLYDGSQWRIFNQDGAAMPVGAAFNVTVPRAGAGVGIIVHAATLTNTAGSKTFIDNPLTNGNPNAIVLVTLNKNPSDGSGTNDPHPIGVLYTFGKWWIFNQDGVAMPDGAAFNVYIFGNYKIYLPLIRR